MITAIDIRIQASDRQVGALRFQNELLAALNKLPYSTNLEDVVKAMNEAGEKTNEQIKQWETRRIALIESDAAKTPES